MAPNMEQVFLGKPLPTYDIDKLIASLPLSSHMASPARTHIVTTLQPSWIPIPRNRSSETHVALSCIFSLLYSSDVRNCRIAARAAEYLLGAASPFGTILDAT